MIRSLLVLALVTGDVGLVAAQQFDDPAVAACEFIMHEGKAPPASYLRTGVEVDGLTVVLNYTVQVLNVAPRPRQYRCQFEQNADGTFSPEVYSDPDAMVCRDKLPGINATLTSTTQSAEAKAAARAEFAGCEATIKAFLNKSLQMMTEIYVPLSEMDLMSIRPAETALASE